LQILVRLRRFIAPHNPDAARRAAETLKKAARLLVEHPGL
jgi:plasmid stabilization system protein ParE